MLRDVLNSYNKNQIALIEAGTGCGKSMAYLIPALLFAAQHQERTVISTNTINLQEQLLEKDIPILSRALNVDLKTVLVKGMSNYICLRKLEDAMEERLLYPENERKDLEMLANQIDKLKEGSRHELKVLPQPATWEKVGAENDTCTGNECPHFQKCFFFQARKEVQDAQILIVNHHLLFADLSIRASLPDNQGTSLLPAYSRLIIDEAHHIEDIATDYFAKKVNRLQMLKTVSRLLADKGASKLPTLKDKIGKHYLHGYPSDVQSIINRLSIDLPGVRKELLLQMNESFIHLTDFLKSHERLDDETKFRFRERHAEAPNWKDNVNPSMKKLIEGMIKLDQSLKALEGDIEQLKNDKLNDITKSVRFEIRALAMRLSGYALTLEGMIQPEIPKNQVRWIEHSAWGALTNTGIVDASLDLSNLFVQHLFSKFKTVVLSSATLTTNNKFDYFRERFGLNAEEIKSRVKQSLYLSPFNYQEQALLAIPNDLPPPASPDFIKAVAKCVLEILVTTRGGAFILFTSYSMLIKCYDLLKDDLIKLKLTLLKQGEMSRKELIANFTANRYGVLFGTDSFWEGVDVAGDKLRAVIIVKLPFKVPSEPIIQARMEKLEAEGKDPFMDYSIPQAIVKFKQGFGRLIRGRKDRGAIIVLDSRLTNKNYGKLFISSLPKCQEIIAPEKEVQLALKKFYKN